MSQRGGLPDYPLKGLLTMRRGELDQSRVEIGKARDALTRAADEVKKIGNTISGIEKELRDLCGTGSTIDTDRHAALSVYLKDRFQAMQNQMVELRKAEQQYEISRNRLHRVKQGVMVLEKHKETKDQEYELEAARQEQKLLDEMWLQRKPKD